MDSPLLQSLMSGFIFRKCRRICKSGCSEEAGIGADSKIEWRDHTFNPWIGCAHKIDAEGVPHPGCEHCFAEAFTKFTGKAAWGPNGTRTKTSQNYWRQPLVWNAAAEKQGQRARVFCASFADVFEDWEGPIQHHSGVRLWHSGTISQHEAADPSYYSAVTMADLRRDLFALIDATPWLDSAVLTKRPENVRRMWPQRAMCSINRASTNVLVERLDRHLRQRPADLRRRGTRAITGAVIFCPCCFLSMEPLLTDVKLWHRFDGEKVRNWQGALDWVIVGGESGHGARPCHPAGFARFVVNVILAAGMAFFFKQWGEWLPISQMHNGEVDALSTFSEPSPRYPGRQDHLHRPERITFAMTRRRAFKATVCSASASRPRAGCSMADTWDEFPSVEVPP